MCVCEREKEQAKLLTTPVSTAQGPAGDRGLDTNTHTLGTQLSIYMYTHIQTQPATLSRRVGRLLQYEGQRGQNPTLGIL